MHDDFCNMPGALVFSYARIHSVKTPQKRIGCAVRAVCAPSIRSDNSLHATSTP